MTSTVHPSSSAISRTAAPVELLPRLDLAARQLPLAREPVRVRATGREQAAVLEDRDTHHVGHGTNLGGSDPSTLDR